MSDAQPRVEHDSIDRDCSDQQGMMSYTIFWKENPSVPLVSGVIQGVIQCQLIFSRVIQCQLIFLGKNNDELL